jgi:hypothetical protein
LSKVVEKATGLKHKKPDEWKIKLIETLATKKVSIVLTPVFKNGSTRKNKKKGG